MRISGGLFAAASVKGKNNIKERTPAKRSDWRFTNNERVLVIVQKKGLEPVTYLFTLWQINAHGTEIAMRLKIIVPPHPLIAHWLTMLRDVSTPPPIYATALEQIGKWLTYEAIREWLPYRKESVETSYGTTDGTVVESRVPLLAIPNLPAGLQLWEGARDVLPNATLCLGGVPEIIEENAGVIIYKDQIAEGNELLKDLKQLDNQKVATNRIKVITALASNPGLKRIGEAFADLTIYAACIDADVAESGDILPGIGNPSSRINTRFTSSN